MSVFDLFKKKNSGTVAKDRLKLLLVSDRASCSPEIMEAIKNDIIKVISKYMEIDSDGLDIQITQTESEENHGTVPAIFANIPIKTIRNGSDARSEAKRN
ncbi:cell division topological specificity factor MinE [Lachnotalea sp. AF33-28]|uniref:cell division topological specificity factor MinE n=1 Tax=Lachnotalea sp. AF33-28 TaxID=2292046 RepID=UPI000E474C37|nr:cell division topological specificity factor MinE [Lachnotalea sp. AF33-28]RHP29879.1 cell division topological specificity factor MinE [Lachnotalea sp. AF33-28]